MADVFSSRSGVMTSNVFRNCFPYLCGGIIIESMGVKVVTSVTDYVKENARTFRHNRRTRSNPIMCNGDGVTAKTAITLTTDHDCNVKISTKRQHQEITTSTGQDKEALLVQGNGHKGGDIAHVQPLDVELRQLHPIPIAPDNSMPHDNINNFYSSIHETQ